jgi:hypothetical protein
VVYCGSFGKRILVSDLEFDTQRDDDFEGGERGIASPHTEAWKGRGVVS